MPRYCVNRNAQTNGDYEVHLISCHYLPYDFKYLGEHSDCSSAVSEAKKTFSKSKECNYCCNQVPQAEPFSTN
jgi:hypothetical protein